MRQISPLRPLAVGRALFATGCLLLALPTGRIEAAELLGLYVGGGIGQSRIDVAPSFYGGDFPGGDFRQNHSAFKVMAGIRPISLLGAEIDYLDFGHPGGDFFYQPADASIKGAAAFGMLYLPVPVVDVYLKAGLARLESTINAAYPVQTLCVPCAPDRFHLSRDNTSGAGGAGVQYGFGPWAVRAEYERFHAAGGNPSLLTAGFTWKFF